MGHPARRRMAAQSVLPSKEAACKAVAPVMGLRAQASCPSSRRAVSASELPQRAAWMMSVIGFPGMAQPISWAKRTQLGEWNLQRCSHQAARSVSDGGFILAANRKATLSPCSRAMASAGLVG